MTTRAEYAAKLRKARKDRDAKEAAQRSDTSRYSDAVKKRAAERAARNSPNAGRRSTGPTRARDVTVPKPKVGPARPTTPTPSKAERAEIRRDKAIGTAREWIKGKNERFVSNVKKLGGIIQGKNERFVDNSKKIGGAIASAFSSETAKKPPEPTTGKGSLQRASSSSAASSAAARSNAGRAPGNAVADKTPSKPAITTAQAAPAKKVYDPGPGRDSPTGAERPGGPKKSSYTPPAATKDAAPAPSNPPAAPVKAPSKPTPAPVQSSSATNQGKVQPKKSSVVSAGEASNKRLPDGTSVRFSYSWKPGKAPGDTERTPESIKAAKEKASKLRVAPPPVRTSAKWKAMNRNK